MPTTVKLAGGRSSAKMTGCVRFRSSVSVARPSSSGLMPAHLATPCPMIATGFPRSSIPRSRPNRIFGLPASPCDSRRRVSWGSTPTTIAKLCPSVGVIASRYGSAFATCGIARALASASCGRMSSLPTILTWPIEPRARNCSVLFTFCFKTSVCRSTASPIDCITSNRKNGAPINAVTRTSRSLLRHRLRMPRRSIVM